MNTKFLKTTLTLAVIGAGLAALPAQAVQTSFSGTTSIANPDAVVGTDELGDTWQTHNGPELLNSSFSMADRLATPQIFNRLNIDTGLGTFANSFQLTVNKSQNGLGFKGITQEAVASGLFNSFIVMPDLLDSGTWISWNVAYKLMDDNGLYQRILFTAPLGTELSQGLNFSANVNFSGIMTNDTGWAASFDDREAPVVPPISTVPEPGSMMLVGLGLLGLGRTFKRKQS